MAAIISGSACPNAVRKMANFNLGLVTAQEALNGARAAGAHELAAGIKSRLASYATGHADRP